jgi:hypothetical protein
MPMEPVSHQVWLGLAVYMGVWGQRGGYEQYWTQVSVGGAGV